MKALNWSNILLTVYHAALVLAAAYAASHQQWAWAVPAMTSLAGLSQAPTWTAKAGPVVAAGAALAGAATLAPLLIGGLPGA